MMEIKLNRELMMWLCRLFPLSQDRFRRSPHGIVSQFNQTFQNKARELLVLHGHRLPEDTDFVVLSPGNDHASIGVFRAVLPEATLYYIVFHIKDDHFGPFITYRPGTDTFTFHVTGANS